VLKTRILLHAFDPLDGDVVKRLVLAEPDMEVVAEVGRDGDLVEAVCRTRADVVLASMHATEPTAACRRLLAESTRLRVLAFWPPEAGSVIELVAHETEMAADPGPRTLVEKIRGAAA
jgi:DNA-binding NarL/FixJ family response regulator